MNYLINLNNEEFQFIEEIAEGQIGAVYRVKDNSGNIYALKAIKPFILENDPRNNLPKLKEGIRREAYLLSNFQHKNVVKFIKTINHEYLGFCIIMEYVSNGNLRQRINDKLLKPHEIIKILDDLLEVLIFFHASSKKFPLGIVHLDLEPKNLLFDKNEEIKICDFHFSRQVGKTINISDFPTPNHPIDKLTDILQTGKLLYEMLTFEESNKIAGKY